ncbi:L-lysine-aminomutase [Nemania sp. FL0916]|nr:L-lysine-aminomutase [Nemania sp. FL0916]
MLSLAARRLPVSRRPTNQISTPLLRRRERRNASTISEAFSPASLHGPEFWRQLPSSSTTPRFEEASFDDFISWDWNKNNVIETENKIYELIEVMVPQEVPQAAGIGGMQSRDQFAGDVRGGMKKATMSVRLMPYVLSRINWADPANCPIFRQFVPLGSIMEEDHPVLKLDSQNEQADSPVDGVVHRYPEKALFLPIGVCPVYCVFCTRAYGVGADTVLVMKGKFKLASTRLKRALDYIESQPDLRDVVVSGGDAFYLPHHIMEWIGNRLIGMKNIERFRFATRGLAVSPSRFLDKNDPWTDVLIQLSDKARRAGKHMALHTHFDHPNEISWITEKAALRLSQASVMVRNQSVLLRGINDNVETMSTLIRRLGSMNIQPYYVYQCDMGKKLEHFRTSLQTILDMESEIRGSIAGFYMPSFVVDLAGGGGKRLACSYDTYDRATGVSTFRAPAVTRNGKKGQVFKHFDPLRSSQQPALS